MGISHPLIGLRSIRQARRATVAELAETIGVAPTSYSRFETGMRRIYFDKAITLADKLGVRVDDLREPLDEQGAIQLCDTRDKAAIAAGTFNPMLWRTEEPKAPPPPPLTAPPPPPLGENAALEGWDA
jgi:transcriptional regulator with XRE-family HTH domain